MPNVPQLIRNVAQSRRVQQSIVEKDYALSYLIAAVSATEGLSHNLVLKGGTALKKLYFPDYRFSEDLDYSTQEAGPIQQIDTLDEPILAPTENRRVLHGFEEDFYSTVPVYSLVEIAAEKMRALLQSEARLLERGWGASRVCRDYYDLWNLLQLPWIKSPNLIALLDQKCQVRGISFKTPYAFISDDLLSVARREWRQQLLPFVPDAPPAEELIKQVETLILSLWD